MAEIKFVDWDGLVYYDTRSKQYIQNKFDLALKYGGSFDKLADVPSPGVDTINVVYKITESFSTNTIDFVEKVYNLTYAANTLIQVVETSDSQYKFDILVDSAPILTPEGDVVYTKAEINEILKNYVTEEELEEKGYLTEHQSLAGYATEEYVNDAVAGVEVDLTGYATETYVNEAIAGLEIPDPDLTGYATETWVNEQGFAKTSDIPVVPTKVSELENDAGYITAQDIPETDLSNYYTKTETDTAITNAVDAINIPDVSNFVTAADVEAMGYIKEIPAEYVTETELDAKGYLTEHQSLEGYATQEYVAQKIAEAELSGGDIDLSAYYTKSETDTAIKTAVDAIDIPDVSGLATKEDLSEVESKIPSLNGYATEEWVTDQDFAKISDIPVVPTNVSAFTNDAGYLTSIPDEYVTETELDAKGYLTEHQDLSNYALKSEIPSLEGLATETYVDEKIAEIPVTDLTGYATETYVNNAITNIDIPTVPTNISAFNNDVGYLTEIPSDYITDSELDSKGFASQNDLDNLSDNFDTLNTTVTAQTTAIEELQDNVSDNTTAISTIQENIDIIENEVADLKAIDHSQYIDQNTLTNALASKANDIPFTEDYRVGNAVGEFVVDDSVRGMTVVQILTKLLALTLYNPPTGDIPTGTPESAVEIITEEIPAYELGQDGQPVEVAYKYKTMTPEEAKEDNQTESYLYQIIDPDTGEAIETGYQIATQYQEYNYLTILLPDNITNFHVEDYDALAGDWTQSSWSLVENSDYSITGYKSYTVDAEILSGIAIRVIIKD